MCVDRLCLICRIFSASVDFVAVPVKIMVNGDIEVTHGEYKFYNCAAVVKNAVNTP